MGRQLKYRSLLSPVLDGSWILQVNIYISVDGLLRIDWSENDPLPSKKNRIGLYWDWLVAKKTLDQTLFVTIMMHLTAVAWSLARDLAEYFSFCGENCWLDNFVLVTAFYLMSAGKGYYFYRKHFANKLTTRRTMEPEDGMAMPRAIVVKVSSSVKAAFFIFIFVQIFLPSDHWIWEQQAHQSTTECVSR